MASPSRLSGAGVPHCSACRNAPLAVSISVGWMLRPFPSLLHRPPLPSTPPFLPGWGVGGFLAVFCSSRFVSALAVLSAVPPSLGPFVWWL